MENNLQILVTANLNKGLSINEINRAIKSVEKSGLLKELNLKINIEKNLTGSLIGLNNALSQITKSMNLLNSAENKSSQFSKQASDSINKETEALAKQSQELQRNAEIRKRITTGQDKSERTSTTTGTKFNNTTTSQTITPTGKGNNDVIDHPVVQVINTGAIKEAEKALQSFTSDGSKRIDELTKHFGDADQRVRNLKNSLSDLTIDSSKVDFDKVTKQLRNLENTQKSQIGDLNKGQKEAQKLASQIAEARIAAQNEYSSLQAKQQKELVNNAHKEADLINKQYNQKKEYQKNAELVEAQAHKDNLKRNTILGDARVTDQKLASIMAARQNREFDQNVLAQTKNYTDWWGKALKTRDNQEASKLATSQKRAEKESKDYSNFWSKSLIDRDQKEQRFYTSQNKRLTDNKVASANILDDKRSTYLTSQYDRVIQKMQQMQSAGKVLTESDTAGINTRIQRLDNYRKAQTQIEQRTSKLNSIIASSEKTAASFSGKFGIEKYESSGIGTLITQLKQLDPTSKNAIEQANTLKNKISQIGAEANGAASHTHTFGSALKSVFSNMLMYSGVGSIFYAIVNGIKSGISHVAELDAAMTNLKKVTDETNTTYSRFLEYAHESGNAIGGLTTDVVKSTTEWARLGYSIQQAQALAKQTLVYQNVGDLSSAEEASKSLISTIKGFGVEVDAEGKNITKIVDIYNEVGNKFAISSSGIGEALRRSAASMSESGNSIEESVALATAANSTIQDPARVGQALKTISMRLRGVSEEGEDLSNLVPSLEKKFKSIGLTLEKDDNTFKSTYEIFQDLAGVWGELNDFQRAGILEDVAGKLQGNIAASLITNFADAQNSLTTALNSTGSAARENATYIDSIAGRVALFKNAVEEFWTKSIDSSVIKRIIDLGTELIGVMGNLGNVVVATTGLFILFKGKAILGMAQSLGSAITALTTTTVALNGVQLSAGGATVALTTLQRSIPWIALAGAALTTLYFAFNKTNDSAKNHIESIEEANKKYDDLSYKLKETGNYYEQNYKSIQDNAEIKDKLFEMQNQLIDTYGQEAEGLDLVNGKYEEQIKTLSNLNKAKLDNEIQESEIRVNAANDQKYHSPFIGETFKSVIGNVPLLGRVTEKNYSVMGDDGVGDLNVKQYYEELLRLKKAITDQDLKTLGLSEDLVLTSKDWENIQSVVKDKIAEISPLIEDQNNLLDKQKEKLKIDTFESLAPSIKLDNDQLEFFESINKLTSSLSLKDYSDNIESIVFWVSKLKSDKSNVSEVINKIKEYSTLKGNPEIIKSLNQFMEQSIEVRDSSENMKTLEDAMIALSKGISGSSSYMAAFMKIVVDSKEEIDVLNEAQSELEENNQLSASTVKKLSEKYTDFIKVTGLSKDEIYKFIKAKKDEKTDFIKTEIDKTEVLIRETKKRIELITDELNASMALLDVNSVNSLTAEKLGMKELGSAKQLLSELTTKYSILTSTLNDFNTDKTKTSNDKLNDSYTDTVEILTKLQQKLKDIQKLQDEEENKRRRMRQSSKEYQDSIRETIRLKKEELSLLEQGAKDPSQLVSTKVQTTTKTASDESRYSLQPNPSSTVSTNVKYSDLINKYAKMNGLDPNLIASIIKQESSFNTNSKSSAGAAGLMQLMPGTAKGLGVKNSYDPEQNIAGGTKHFARLVKKYKGDIELALYAYNAGEGNVDKWIKNGQINNIPFKETKEYAPKVLGHYQNFNSGAAVIPTSSVGVTTNKNSNVTTKTTGTTSKEIQSAAEKNEQDIQTLKNEISDEQIKILESIKEGFDRKIVEQEDLSYDSKRTQEKLDPNSVEWRNENSKQVKAKSKIQDIQHQAKTTLQSEMKAMKINSDEWDDVLKKLSSDWLDVQSEKYALLMDNFNSQIDSSKQRITDLDNKIEQSKNRMSQFAEGTPEYNKELNEQIALTKKQKAENENLKKSLETLANSKKLDSATRKKYKEMLDELNLKDYTTDIKELNKTLIDSKAIPLEDKLSDLSYELEVSEAKLKGLKEGTEGYNKELNNQISIINKQIETTNKLKEYYETQSENEELLAADREEAKKKVQELTLSLYKYGDAIKDIRETYADNVISNLKKVYEEQQKLQNAAYDKEKELENKRHEAKMDNLDDEYSKFEDMINGQLKTIDRTTSEEDHQDQLSKLLKEKSDLDSRYSNLRLDTSFEAKAKRVDLQKEIDAKAEEIAKLQRDRGIELNKQGLQDQLEDRKETIEKEKKAETDKNKSFIDNIEALKKKNDEYYDGLLNDEQYFYNMKQSLMSGDTLKIQNELAIVKSVYDTFFKELEKNSGIYGSKIASNLKYSLGLDKDYANNFPTSGDSGGNNAADTVNPVPETKSERDKAWKEYLSNKQKAEAMGSSKGAEYEKLKNRNTELRKKYSFQDGSYNQLKDLKYYHTGGEVGVEGTTTQKWWEKLLKKDESLAVLRNKEVVLDEPQRFINQIASNAQSNMSNISNMMVTKSSDNGTRSIEVTQKFEFGNMYNVDKSTLRDIGKAAGNGVREAVKMGKKYEL
ncbi:phage tail tape measure protein [Paenibacillus odorifer]|uniref:phage tail tape measure protein n=1 Tax=Paenibacillus odorifer TaxID=189426 RepID=UPI00096C5C98|nr:phage tail tape measure protein [Paenibacillus odorifer]OMD10718.1 phage tail tape measure protein [Paenibacillus odorifer]